MVAFVVRTIIILMLFTSRGEIVSSDSGFFFLYVCFWEFFLAVIFFSFSLFAVVLFFFLLWNINLLVHFLLDFFGGS